MDFNKNKLINKVLDKYYETFEIMLDTADFVPAKFNDKISKYIYKNMKKKFKEVDKEDKLYLKNLRIKLKLEKQKNAKTKKKLKKKSVRLFFKRLFNKK